MEIYYGIAPTPASKGKQFRNAALYQRPDTNATRVYIDGHYPKIQADYEALLVPVHLVQGNRTTAPTQPNVDRIPETAYLPTAERREQQRAAEIPGDWQQMRWADLRRLAASVCDYPVRNKNDAFLAIESEIKRRREGI